MAKKLSYEALLSALNNSKVRCVVRTELGWVVEAEGPPHAVCPDCGATSDSRHSRYWRKLQDLPLQGASVTIKVLLGRWRCRRQECKRKIFTERVAGVLQPHSQHTIRLTEVHRLVGRALGGRSGEQLLNRLGMPSSRHTLLREVIRGARGTASQPAVRVLGVDDCGAWSKGQSFGTVLVDLERSEVVDLLPTRSAEALSEWLAKHPEVMVVSRDRQGSYAQGARSTAPEAVHLSRPRCDETMVLSFRNVLRLGKLVGLHSWIERAQNSGIHAMMRFVRTLKQDLSAIEAAVTEPLSNGPVEGHISRLKTLKRQMYGRAGIELLRARLLPEMFGLPQDLHQT